MLYKVQKFQENYINSLNKTDICKFIVGDMINVGLRIIDGETERLQEFHGVCIAIRKKGIGTNILVRKVTDNVEIERNIMIYSPIVSYIKLIQTGFIVNRAKLYYLRGLRGNKAKIKQAKRVNNIKQNKSETI